MRRFYCTVCKKVKRVQKWPHLISDQASTLPQNRIGECNYHATGRRQPVVMSHVSHVTTKQTKKVS